MITTDEPIMVRNNHPGPAVFSYGRDAENFVEWAGAGDRAGGDIQPVPAALLNHPHFRRALVAGIYQVENGEGMQEQVEATHRAEYQERLAKQTEASTAVIDQQPDNDFIVLKCIAPAQAGSYKLCEADVSVRAKERFAEPPLCDVHKNLAKNYLPRGTGRLVGNQDEMVWEKVKVADRVRQKKENDE